MYPSSINHQSYMISETYLFYTRLSYSLINIFNLNMMKISDSIYIILLYLTDIDKMFLYNSYNIYINKNMICYIDIK